MTRAKTKRIVWTMAVLLALTFVAAMVLHRHEEPKVIGNLSKEDVSEISRIVLVPARDAIKYEMKIFLHEKNVVGVVRKLREYNSIGVSSIQSYGRGQVCVKLKDGTNEFSDYAFKNEEGAWQRYYLH